ncbi:MAG: hypothetical protein ACPGAP_08595, partial [Akkermansiaceae bacterium]
LYVLARLRKAEPAYHAKFYEMLTKSEGIPRGAKAFLALALHASQQSLWGEVMALPTKEQESGYWMPYRNEDA